MSSRDALRSDAIKVVEQTLNFGSYDTTIGWRQKGQNHFYMNTIYFKTNKLTTPREEKKYTYEVCYTATEDRNSRGHIRWALHTGEGRKMPLPAARPPGHD
jgi:hypothetical protein